MRQVDEEEQEEQNEGQEVQVLVERLRKEPEVQVVQVVLTQAQFVMSEQHSESKEQVVRFVCATNE